MKKLLITITLVGAAIFSTFAQSMSSGSSYANNSRFSVAFELGLPISTAADVYNVGVGFSLRYETPIAAGTLFTISGGYTSLSAKPEFGGGSDAFAPFKAGIKYYVNQGFYLEGQLGVTFYVGGGGSVNYFAYSPGIGYTINNNVDIGVRYEGWVDQGTISQIGLHLGYNFQ
jgi:hypothetical protein